MFIWLIVSRVCVIAIDYSFGSLSQLVNSKTRTYTSFYHNIVGQVFLKNGGRRLNYKLGKLIVHSDLFKRLHHMHQTFLIFSILVNCTNTCVYIMK